MPGNPHVQSPSGPIAAKGRIRFLDLLRGAALFGILLANVRQLFLPWDISDFPVALGGNEALSWIDWLIFEVLVDQKFLTLFSLLFGASFAIQFDSIERRGNPVARIYLRRLLILALFGIAHATLLYPAEVLLPYACAGLMLLAIHRSSADNLVRNGLTLWMLTLVWGYQVASLGHVSLSITALSALALVLVAAILWRRDWRVAIAAMTIIVVVAGVGLTLQSDLANADASAANEWVKVRSMIAAIQTDSVVGWPQELQVRREGDLAALIELHLSQYVSILFFFFVFLIWRTLGLFMIGAGLMRKGVLKKLSGTDWRKMAWLAGASGLGMSLLAGALSMLELRGAFDLRWPPLLHAMSALPLAVGIAALVYLVQQRNPDNWCLLRIESAGRTALSNYVGQSAVMAFLAEPWGLGGYGRWGGPALTLLAVLVFAALAMLSHRWLQRYRMGPLEWIWRCGTYWQWLPNKHQTGPERLAKE